MTKAVIVAMHKYTPFGGEYYEPIFDFFIQTMKKYQEEFDRVYLLDSTWGIKVPTDPAKMFDKATVIQVDSALRYYDAYKSAIPQIEEDLVLFLDNDFVIYREGIIADAFAKLEEYGVVSILDTIGTYKTDKLKLGNKFCPYFFATWKHTLEKYAGVDWSPDAMPYTETFGLLTEAMLNDGVKPFEMEDDKSNCLFDGTQDGERSKDLGYYHIRSGSTAAYLLATRDHGDRETYHTYITNQPKSEFLRHFAWFFYMCEATDNLHKIGNELYYSILEVVKDAGLTEAQWHGYYQRFVKYYNL